MMRIPPSIKIGVRRIKIIKRKRLKGMLGYLDWDAKKLYLLFPHPDIKNTLLHEVIHGLSHHFSLELTEHQVTALANGLRQVFVDNILLLDTLRED